MLKRTPLFEVHKKLGAKLVEFGGWEMPVYYSTVIEEHMATRQAAGLFDVCHMGEFDVKGKDAKKFLQHMCTSDMNRLKDGKAQYACLCREDGSTVDDCFVYQLTEEHFVVVVNAGTKDKDWDWFTSHTDGFDVELHDDSDNTGKIDIQGPKAQEILQKLTTTDLSEIKRFHFTKGSVADIPALISRTGYTGEDGFELYVESTETEKLWNTVLESGKEDGLLPAGLGARDTLRIEACYSLYGHELSDSITPVEAGIGWVVSKNKGDFMGSDVLLQQKSEGAPRKNVGIEMIDRGIIREHYPIYKDDQQIGETSSGTFSPLFKKSIGMGFVDPAHADDNTPIHIKIRDKLLSAKITKKPFYAFMGGKKEA